MIRNKKGITLVALVVTIVVLLILAGVSLNLVIGQNGLIQKAKDAKSATEQARTDEEQDMSDLSDWADQTLQGNGGGSGGGSGTGDGSGTGTGGDSPSGGNTGTGTEESSTSLPFTEETKPYLPTGFTKVPGTDLSTGLVIQDGSGNQYVWVEVPKTEEVYKTAKLNINFETDADAYTKIENDLHEYTSTYRNETGYSDTWTADSSNEGWFTSYGYTKAKNNMLKSVYENGGFYVGRYEAGIETTGKNRTSNEDKNADGKYIKPTTVPVTKADAYPYIFVTRTQAQKLAESVNSGDRTSSLMFGVQWDLVLQYLKTNGTSHDDLMRDSTGWGNYSNAQFNVTNTNAKYSENSGSTWNPVKSSYPKSGSALLTTGANEERNSKMNICDLAGNVMEWTLENYSYSILPCAGRGGYYSFAGSTVPVYVRVGTLTSGSSGSDVGFRVSLY